MLGERLLALDNRIACVKLHQSNRLTFAVNSEGKIGSNQAIKNIHMTHGGE